MYNVSQEKLFEKLFAPFYNEMDSEDSDQISMSSKKVSEIMNGKAGIHSQFKAVIDSASVDEVAETFKKDICPYISLESVERIKWLFSSMIEDDKDIPPKDVCRLTALIESEKDLSEVLAGLFKYAVCIPYEKPVKEPKIHYCSSVIKRTDESDILAECKEQFGSYIDLDKTKDAKQLETGKMYKLTTECGLKQVMVRATFMTKLWFTYNGIRYEAETSISNWISESYMNNQLSAGKAEFSLIFKGLNKDNGTVHIYIIGEM